MEREEAIEVIRKNWPDASFTQLREALETLIPELRESEDERNWKAVLECVKDEALRGWLEKQKTSEEAIRYVKENHSPDEVSDFQAAMNIAVAKAYDKGVQDTLEKQKEPSELEQLAKLREMTHEIREAYERGIEVGRAESKQEWNEEDEKKRNGLIKGLEDRMGFGWASDPFSREDYIAWLNSLKNRGSSPKSNTNPPSWKPSEEQMKALYNVLHPVNTIDGDTIKSLYNELTKLM